MTSKILIISGPVKGIQKKVDSKLAKYTDWHVVLVTSVINNGVVVVSVLLDRFRRW